MRKALLWIAGLGFVLLSAPCFAAETYSRACIKTQCYTLELARTPEERSRGLMFHRKLLAGEGMLFVFDRPGRLDFWMKNMAFAIDIIWIGNDGRIVDLLRNAPPCKADPCDVYAPEFPARYVLEVPAGDVDRFLFSRGDTVQFK